MEHEKNQPSPRDDPEEDLSGSMYEIRVQGCMDTEFWADWFGGLQCAADPEQELTILRGPIADQAELYGLLSRLRNKGLTLISVQQIHSER